MALLTDCDKNNNKENNDCDRVINKFDDLIIILNNCFSNNLSETIDNRRDLLMNIIKRFQVQKYELDIFALFDSSKPYTRNMLITNDYYSLLLLCWNPNMQSKIHDHPCESCILMPLSGSLREERYAYDGKNILSNKPHSIRFYLEGQVSHMNNNIGLHRISNPRKYVGAISLHLYYPAFSTCQAWSQPIERNVGTNTTDDPREYELEVVKMGSYSIRGIRTPTLEGRLGSFGQVMKELKNTTKLVATHNNNNHHNQEYKIEVD